METRRLTCDNKPILVFDNLELGKEFNEFEAFIKHSAAFTPSQGDSFKAAEYVGMFWVYSLDPEKFSQSPVSKLLLNKIQEKFGKNNWILTEARVNSTQYGDSGFVHTDGHQGFNKTITCLIYLNDDWDPNYYGETIFYENEEAREIVALKYHRTVIFDGSIEHSFRAPSRICNKKRLIMVAKYGCNNIQ